MSNDSYSIQFQKLFLEHYQGLYVHAVGFVKDEETAKDIVHEVYAHVWEHRLRLLSGKDPLPVMYLLVRNKAIDFLRHKKVREKFEMEAKSSLPAADLADYDDYEERVAAALRAVEQLPPKTRQIFKECFLEGHTHRETAEKYGISINTVRNYIANAISTLRKNKNLYSIFFL